MSVTGELNDESAEAIANRIAELDALRASAHRALLDAAVQDILSRDDGTDRETRVGHWRRFAREHEVRGLSKAVTTAVRGQPTPPLVDVSVENWPYPLRHQTHPIPSNGYFGWQCNGATNEHAIADRDGSWACRYCGVLLTCGGCNEADVIARDGNLVSVNKPFAAADHVVPRARGGPDDLANLVLTCHRCNASKGATPLAEWFIRLAERGLVAA